MSYILSDDATLYYEEYGTGTPMILLPGLLGTIGSDWRRFLPEFSRTFHTIAVDLRGHGKSNNPSGRFSLRILVDDLSRLMDTLQVERTLICGYSLGGYVGLKFGLESQERVAGLVMHGTKYSWTPGSIQAAIETLSPTAILESTPRRAETLQLEHTSSGEPDGWKQLVLTSRDFLYGLPKETIHRHELKQVRFPVVISRCDEDPMIEQEEAERLQRAIPSARLLVLNQCNHAIRSVSKTSFVESVRSYFGQDVTAGGPEIP